jgi:hypothetical protein
MKATGATEAWLEVPFVRSSVTPVTPPEGSDGPWHKYVISQGDNEITGLCAGTLNHVIQHVDSMTERLNERRVGKLKHK